MDFIAYPVPYDNEVNIQYTFEYETNVNIQVYDMKGSLIRESVDKNYIPGTIGKTTIDMSTFDNQIYFVKLSTNQGVLVKKIISSDK